MGEFGLLDWTEDPCDWGEAMEGLLDSLVELETTLGSPTMALLSLWYFPPGVVSADISLLSRMGERHTPPTSSSLGGEHLSLG